MIEEELRKLPPRPYIPAMLYIAFVAAAMAYAVDEVFWRVHLHTLSVRLSIACLALVFIGALLAGTLLAKMGGCLSAMQLACSIFLLITMFAAAVGVHFSWEREATGCRVSPSGVQYKIGTDPRISKRGYSYDAECIAGGHDQVGSVRLMSNDIYEPGQLVTVVGRSRAIGEDDWSRSLDRKGIACEVDVIKTTHIDAGSQTIFERIRSVLLKRIEPDRSRARSIIAALTCGRTTDLAGNGLRDRCAEIGVSHLFAVSGAHLGIVTSLLFLLMNRFGIAGSKATALSLLPCLGFVVLTGASFSSVRSFLMSCFGLLTGCSDRRRHALSALSLTACLMIAVDPRAIFDLGFCFSFLSVLAINLFYSYGTCFFIRCHVPPTLASSISATLCAQIATLPLAVPVFGSISLLAPISNIILAPLVGALLSFSIVLMPFIAFVPLILEPVYWVSSSCVFLIDLLGAVPFASLSISDPDLMGPIVLGLMTVLYRVWPEPYPRSVGLICGCLALCLVIPFLRYRFWAPAQVVVMDVGQADCILIRDGSSTVLVDAGVDERASEALLRNRVLSLDSVIITHWDLDHYGGLEAILKHCRVRNIIVAQGASDGIPPEIDKAISARIKEMSFGDRMKIGSFGATMVWPRERVVGDSNGDSLCLKLEYHQGTSNLRIALTGDSEKDQEHEYDQAIGDVDVLKLGHHGSKVSVDDEVMSVLKPELCIASAGSGNRYGHPSKECQNIVAASKSRFLCTKDVGDITVSPSERGFRVHVGRTASEHAMLE